MEPNSCHYFKTFLINNKIERLTTSCRHPQANAVERYNKSIIQLLRIYVNENHKSNHIIQVLNHI